MKQLRFIMFTAVICFFSTAQAAKDSGVLLQLVPLYESTEDTNGGVTSKSTTLSNDLTLGYVMNGGFALGLRYTMSNSNTDTGGVTGTSAFTAYGPTVGYFHDGGFFGLFSYLLSVSSRSGTPETNVTGTGMQLDVGYIHRFAGSFGLGAQLAYKSFTFTKATIGSVETTVDSKTTLYTLPQVVLSWIF
jgi:hypothetical protein